MRFDYALIRASLPAAIAFAIACLIHELPMSDAHADNIF